MAKARKEKAPKEVEILQNDANLPAVKSASFDGLILGGGYKIKGTRTVTRPVLTQIDEQPYAIKLDSPIFQATQIKNKDGTEAKDEEGNPRNAPKIAYVTDMTTGEERTWICNAAFTSALETMYPLLESGKWDYEGRVFGVRSMKVPHKGTRMIRKYQIVELEIEQ